MSVYMVLMSDNIENIGHDPEDDLIKKLDGDDGEEADTSNPFAGIDRDRFERLLAKLPDIEQDLIYMRYVCFKRQEDLAAIVGMTQAAVSYRIDRAIERLKYFVSLPDVTEEELLLELPTLPMAELDVKILLEMWRHGSQTQTAKAVGITQGRARHRFFATVERMKRSAEHLPKWKKYADLFGGWKRNLAREIVLPQWQVERPVRVRTSKYKTNARIK